MKVAIRVDGSKTIGTGHLMRCLTLAKKLKQQGAEILFVSRYLEPALAEFIQNSGFSVKQISHSKNPELPVDTRNYSHFLGVSQQQDAQETISALSSAGINWLIVDHYALDQSWEKTLFSALNCKILAIDDLANRSHDCDVVLDQNFYAQFQTRYDQLVPKRTVKLLGPSFAVIRDEFAAKRRKHLDQKLTDVLIFFGGSDYHGYGFRIAKALAKEELSGLKFHLMAGQNDPFKDHCIELSKKHNNITYHGFLKDPTQLMASCQLFIGSGGTVTLERCAIGLPGLIYFVAENQRVMTEDLATYGAQICLGSIEQCDLQILLKNLKELKENPKKLTALATAASRLVDGNGATRVVEKLRSS